MLKFNPITGQFDLVGTSSSGGGIGGTTGTTDKAITRADGTGGSTLQGSMATIADDGTITVAVVIATDGAISFTTGVAGSGRWTVVGDGSTFQFNNRDSGYSFSPSFFSTSGTLAVPTILKIGDDNCRLVGAANILALRNGTNGQTLIVSKTFTDPGNKSEFQTVVTGSVVAFTIVEAGSGAGSLTGYTFDKPVTAGANAIKGLITTNANATTGLIAGALAALTNASIVIYDGTGTAYRVPCVTP